MRAIVYATYEYKKQRFYVRLVGKETQMFPHGIALGNTYDTKKDAEQFAHLVNEYVRECRHD